MATYTEEVISVGGTKVHLLRGGQGDPLLFLHGAGGPAGWRLFHDRLAEHYTVYAPSHPGFGESDSADWMENIRDLAEFYLWFLDVLGLDRLDVIGSSMGGWLAAELALMSHRSFRTIVLVDPAGLQPEEGEIYDIFFWPLEEVRQHQFYDHRQVPEYDLLYGSPPTPEQRALAQRNREMAARLVWKPYLFSRQLPHLLPRIAAPVLIVWGRQDAIIPVICGEQYRRLLPNSRLAILDQCGHSPQLEKPDEFLKIVLDFLAEADALATSARERGPAS